MDCGTASVLRKGTPYFVVIDEIVCAVGCEAKVYPYSVESSKGKRATKNVWRKAEYGVCVSLLLNSILQERTGEKPSQ